MSEKWETEVSRMAREWVAMEVSDLAHARILADEGFKILQGRVESLRRERRTMYLIGNGASASMASHYSADLAKNGHIHTQVFSDLSLITALSNDIGYNHVFSIPLKQSAVSGDILIAISSSGKSRNILNAVEEARVLGLFVVTLSAMAADNPLRTRGNLNFYIPAMTYGHSETGHAAILHHMMDQIELSGERMENQHENG
jgi:D-sedoheptulose 7-phosphate isomerase